MALRFDHRVAVITGAGGGLGRSYALLLGSLGAKVIVNDLGSALSGLEQDDKVRPADLVVDEIRRKGGEAVANYDSVQQGEKIIATAIQAYGRVDILINNAGILRDKSFAKMSEEDWDMVMLVHLKGAFNCTKAVWPFMVKQQYGRIVNTASGAGLYGNFGQANYSAAKLALVGLTKSLAAEGSGKNIYINVIAPLAGTRMTETILPKEIVTALKPEFIAPIVAYLSHECSTANGDIVECGGGWVAKLRWERTKGKHFPPSFTPLDVQREWSTISDFTQGTTYPVTLQESLVTATENLQTIEQATLGTKKTDETSENLSKSEKLFMLMDAYLKHNPEEAKKLVQKVGYTYNWIITEKKNGPVKSSWTINLKTGLGSVERDKREDVDATFTMPEPDFVQVCLGALNPQIAFIQGKMKIKGSMKAALKFTPDLFPKISESLLHLSIPQAIQTYLQNTSTPNLPAVVSSSSNLKSRGIFDLIAKFLQTDVGKQLSSKVGYIYQFNITENGQLCSRYIIDLKSSPPVILTLSKGTSSPVSADTIMTIADDDFASLVKGQLDPQVAFSQQKMKVQGNMQAAIKFTPDLFPKMSSL